MTNKQQFGTPFSATNAGSAIAVATVTGSTVAALYVTDVSGSTTLAGSLLTIKSGSAIIWEDILAANTPYEHSFEMPIGGILGSAVSVTVGSGAATSSRANIAGFRLDTP